VTKACAYVRPHGRRSFPDKTLALVAAGAKQENEETSNCELPRDQYTRRRQLFYLILGNFQSTLGIIQSTVGNIQSSLGNIYILWEGQEDDSREAWFVVGLHDTNTRPVAHAGAQVDVRPLAVLAVPAVRLVARDHMVACSPHVPYLSDELARLSKDFNNGKEKATLKGGLRC
jgi:hypothetical protein